MTTRHSSASIGSDTVLNNFWSNVFRNNMCARVWSNFDGNYIPSDKEELKDVYRGNSFLCYITSKIPLSIGSRLPEFEKSLARQPQPSISWRRLTVKLASRQSTPCRKRCPPSIWRPAAITKVALDWWRLKWARAWAGVLVSFLVDSWGSWCHGNALKRL